MTKDEFWGAVEVGDLCMVYAPRNCVGVGEYITGLILGPDEFDDWEFRIKLSKGVYHVMYQQVEKVV